jgi:hypothetical protein
MADNPKGDPVKECEAKVEELQEENATLRQSAETFGALAERLNERAIAEQRVNAEEASTDDGSSEPHGSI